MVTRAVGCSMREAKKRLAKPARNHNASGDAFGNSGAFGANAGTRSMPRVIPSPRYVRISSPTTSNTSHRPNSA
eukprot:1775710-Pyramimonas_sp.AAC.1